MVRAVTLQGRKSQQLVDLGFEVCQGGASVDGRGDRGGNFACGFGSKKRMRQKWVMKNLVITVKPCHWFIFFADIYFQQTMLQ